MVVTLKAYAEKLELDSNSSLRSLNRRLDEGIPFQWHHHALFELTFTLNSRGQRYIGDHVDAYDDRDLVLVGPNLPHTWHSHSKIDEDGPHVALVIWFRPEWAVSIGEAMVEFARLTDFLNRAGSGLRFSRAVADGVFGRFQDFFSAAPRERLVLFFSILSRLMDDGGDRLGSRPVEVMSPGESADRIDRVLTFIHGNYATPIGMEALADIAAVSLSGLHRLFTKHTGKSVTDYVIQMRIGEACARLLGTAQPIAFIAEAVGYRSLANFNRQFRALKGMTPKDYRERFRGPR
jgi:AraC-like DNA-binding protein